MSDFSALIMSSYVWILAISSCATWMICKLLHVIRRSSLSSRKPPALPTLPLVGSLPFLCRPERLHELFMQKATKYGNVFSFDAGNRYTVVVNGLEPIRQCLLSRSTDVAGRAEVYVERNAYNPLGRGIVFRQYDDRLRKNRSHSLSILKHFGWGSKSRIESIIHDELSHVIDYISNRIGQNWSPARLLELSTMNIIHRVMFAERLDYSDPAAEYLATTLRLMADSIDALYDFLPICTYFPRWRRRIENLKPVGEEMKVFLAKRINKLRGFRTDDDKDNSESADYNTENFVSEYLSRPENQYDGSDEELNYILRDLLAGGTDTTSGQLSWALILLANNQHIQKRLHADLDDVVDRSRYPTLDDAKSLPYLEAVIMEVMRMNTAVPLGGPRSALVSTEIGGYTVPPGTMILLNLWSAHMDKSVWSDPEEFRPERFLDDTGRIINKEKLITFSLGKRSCPGELLARHEMFLFVATLLHRFKMLPPDDRSSVRDVPHIVRVNSPADYTLRLVPR